MSPLLLALALAATAHDEVARGAQLYRQLDYEAALPVLNAVADDAAAPPADHVDALLWIGVTAAALGDSHRAERAFTDALTLDPQATLPSDAPPRVVALFAATRARLPKPLTHAPSIESAPPAAPAPHPAAPDESAGTATTGALRDGPASGDARHTGAVHDGAVSASEISVVTWSLGGGAALALAIGAGLHALSFGTFLHAGDPSTSQLDAKTDVDTANAEVTGAAVLYVAGVALGAAAVLGVGE